MSLVDERNALLAEIRDAFANVGRDGGVSWSEAEVIDDYGSADERAEARARDAESGWIDLVHDASWKPDEGIGGWSFLDPIGFRYYFPAAMFRCVESGEQGVGMQLGVLHFAEAIRAFPVSRWAALDAWQCGCVRGFLSYMTDLARITAEHCASELWEWNGALSYWDELFSFDGEAQI